MQIVTMARLNPQAGGSPALSVLDADLMKSAEVLLRAGEDVPVVYRKPSGNRLECFLAGYSEDGEQALLTLWRGDRLRSCICAFDQVELPTGTYNRLRNIAQAQRGGREINDVRKAPESLAEFLATRRANA